jgi:hypothetical protein
MVYPATAPNPKWASGKNAIWKTRQIFQGAGEYFLRLQTRSWERGPRENPEGKTPLLARAFRTANHLVRDKCWPAFPDLG